MKQLADFFRRAERIVMSHRTDRDVKLPDSGGEVETSWAHIARTYNALTGQAMTEVDALTFMQCVKLVREQRDPHYTEDHFDDLIGYTAIKGVARHKAQMSPGPADGK